MHEIRNPINAITAIIEELKERNLDQSIQTEIEVLYNSSELLLNLLNDLLDLSRIEQGSIEFHFSPCSPKKIAENTILLFQSKAKRNSIKLEFDFSREDVVYNGDPIRIQQILMNLLNNAINYTGSGRVLLTLKNQIEGNLLRSTFRVYDTGKGITELEKEKIFQKFYRANEQTQGAGLGLYISKTLAELMGGNLTFESPPSDKQDFKTVFILDLSFPILNSELKLEKETYHSLPVKRVPVVDDEEINLLVLSQILKSLRINFTIANNSLEALNLAFSVEHDFVLVDIEMPELNGIEIAKRVRFTENLSQNAKLIAITGYELSRLDKSSIKIFDTVLTKPITKKLLYATFRELVQK